MLSSGWVGVVLDVSTKSDVLCWLHSNPHTPHVGYIFFGFFSSLAAGKGVRGVFDCLFRQP